MKKSNKVIIEFLSLSENESFARSIVACYALSLNPSISEITDIKTAVSEAVTNAIVHGYPNKLGKVIMELEICDRELHINIFDDGAGIENIDRALEPFYTTKPEDERSGMGFTIMQSFMDNVKVVSKKDQGTKVYMTKIINPAYKDDNA